MLHCSEKYLSVNLIDHSSESPLCKLHLFFYQQIPQQEINITHNVEPTSSIEMAGPSSSVLQSVTGKN